MRSKKGITLIALVVTVVILIILATIGIGAIFGKNGLISRVQQAKEKAQIEAAREKLVLKLTDLQADAIEQGKKLTLEDLIIINTTEKDMKVETTTTDEEGNEIEEKVVRYKGDEEGEKDYTKVTVDGYVFKVDDDFGVTYIDARNDPEKGPGYNGGDADDELGDGGITLDEDKEHDPNADKLHDTVPEGWVGIYNETDLINMKNDLSKKYILMADIPLSKTWTPLGDSKTEFTGYLNGNGHTITNMNISGTDGYLGMFARTSGTAYISNLNIKNYTLTGKGKYIGGLVGYNKGNIRGVSFTGNLNINGEASYVGGLVGFHRYDSKTTTGIERVYTGGTLNAPQGTCVGGIVGLMEGYSETYKDKTYIKNSYSTMTTTGNEHVGGLVGEMRYSHLENTYTIGKVTGKKNTGGVVATVNSSCYAENTYWGKGITTQKTSALGIIQTMPKLAKQASYNNYDFAQVWGIDENETTAYLLGMEVPSILRELMEGYITQQGEGTEENPYEIWTEEQLYNVRNHLDAHWIVMADLDLSDYESWTPIGTEAKPFMGNFNGNGHTIENMTIKNCGNNSGLFGYMDEGDIYDFALENYYIEGTGAKNVGGVLGCLKSGRVYRVYTEGKITMTGSSEGIGGIVGSVDRSGSWSEGSVRECCTVGEIKAPSYYCVGGIAGYLGDNKSTGTFRDAISDCLSFVDLTGYENVGGIAGRCNWDWPRNCISLGSISAVNASESGCYGSATFNNVLDGDDALSALYWCSEVSGIHGGPLMLGQIRKRNSFSKLDFSTIWAIEEGKSTPYLQGVKIPDEVYDIFEKYGVLEGSGTSVDPYLIHNVKELKNIKYDDGKKYYYRLANDIDLGAEAKWTPIGTEADPFTGNFDGAGYTISNMKIQGSTTENLGTDIGLFGWIDRATIKNVALENYNITGGSAERVGGLVGYGLAPAITNVYTNGTINLAYNRVESNLIGGLIGQVESSDGASAQITQCYAGGSITTQVGNDVGGLVGGAQGTAKRVSITNSYSTANVNGNSTNGVGGLVGAVTTVTIENSYTIGKVQGKGNYVGGLVGYENDGKAYNSYWSEELTTQAESALGIKLTASKLTQQGGYSSWNFTTIWAIENGTSFAYLQGMKIPDAVTQIVKDNTVMTGLGTAASPYIITSKEHLNMIKYDMTGYYKLGNDIDLGSITRWTPIGTEEVPFTGNFNGDGHTIKNLKIDVGSSSNLGDNVGLFGYTNGGTIQNVTLDNYKLNGGYGNNIGALVGYARGTAIMKVNTKGSIYLGYSRVNSENIGGLVGYIETSMTISQCHTEGSISAYSAGYQVGGLVGWAEGTVTIQNSYSTAEVSGYDSVGGIMGWATRGYINYCYATGKVTARGENVGGLLGGRDSGSASSSYWDITTTGTEQGVIGTGRDTATMQTVSNYSGWSTTIWNLVEGSYPTLK